MGVGAGAGTHHFDAAPDWQNDAAPASTPIIQLILCKIYTVRKEFKFMSLSTDVT
jgi:hypothetical protein